VLFVDAGDAFARNLKTQISPEGLVARAELMVDAFGRMGLAAYVPGERDFALGLEALQKLSGKASFPFLAANLQQGDKLLFGSSVIKKVGGLRIGLVGLVGQRVGFPPETLTAHNLTITDPVAAAQAEVASLTKQGVDLLIAVGHFGRGEPESIARAVPELRFFFGSHTGRMNKRAQVLIEDASRPTAWAFAAGSRGKYLGQLEIFLAKGGDVTKIVDGGEAEALKDEIKNHRRSLQHSEKSLARYKEKGPSDPTKAGRHASRIQSLTDSIERTKKLIEEKEARSKTVRRPASTDTMVRNILVPIKASIAEVPEIAAQVTALEKTGLLKPAPRTAAKAVARPMPPVAPSKPAAQPK